MGAKKISKKKERDNKESKTKEKVKNKDKKTRSLSDFDLFVFDWDGTLTGLKIIRTLDQKYGPYWLYKRMKYRKEHKKIDMDSESESKRELKERIMSVFADFYLTLFKPKLHNDVKLLLSTLRARGKKVALFTNATEWRINKELDLFGIRDMFDIVLSAQKIKVIKPDPTGLNIIIRKMRMRKDKVLYIGDMVDDIIMAKTAGVASCALGNGFDKESVLKREDPDFYFEGVEELLEAIRSE